MAQIKIDGEALRAWCKNQGMTQMEVSCALGRSVNYVCQATLRGEMNEAAYRLLLDRYKLPPGAFIPKLEPKKAEASTHALAYGPYALSLQVHPNKVRVGISFHGEELYHAWSNVKDDTETGLMQAVSYAAHMMYKIAQQQELEK